MTKKVVTIARSPRGAETARAADAWISGADPGRPVKRLTVEIDEGLHRRLRVAAAQEGRTMSALVRALLERACPE